MRLLEQIPDLENNYLIVYGDSKGDSQLLKYANESHYRALCLIPLWGIAVLYCNQFVLHNP